MTHQASVKMILTFQKNAGAQKRVSQHVLPIFPYIKKENSDYNYEE